MTDLTAIGGPGGAFPTTLWSSILSAAQGDTTKQRQLLETLLATYWKPVYCCVRFGWHKTTEEAKDIVQSFFLDLLERDFLAGLDPARGRFRNFLKTAVRHFMMNQARSAASIKRGGAMKSIPMEKLEEIQGSVGEPDEIFEREWTRTVLDTSVDQLRQEFVNEGKEIYFRVFELHDLKGDSSYRAVATALGIGESDVRNYLHAARKNLRRIVTQRISDYALDGNEVEEELGRTLG